ncbi:hypothetical protein [Pseudoxanthomonas sp.]|uniref:hypothetical protein n=1 Tax=Pseudoxanthomonas sp. TaxID=1871049 RepID=UPI002590E814|nr:hypothetical protein [Pseudoxanthomonas sp.]MCR6687093.1 hypothetical protein [Pseudoxanthomonas sp.]
MSDESIPVIVAVAGFVVGVLIGGFLSFNAAEDVQRDYDTREKLRAACIGGSEQACRIYAIDYGRGEGFL